MSGKNRLCLNRLNLKKKKKNIKTCSLLSLFVVLFSLFVRLCSISIILFFLFCHSPLSIVPLKSQVSTTQFSYPFHMRLRLIKVNIRHLKISFSNFVCIDCVSKFALLPNFFYDGQKLLLFMLKYIIAFSTENPYIQKIFFY